MDLSDLFSLMSLTDVRQISEEAVAVCQGPMLLKKWLALSVWVRP